MKPKRPGRIDREALSKFAAQELVDGKPMVRAQTGREIEPVNNEPEARRFTDAHARDWVVDDGIIVDAAWKQVNWGEARATHRRFRAAGQLGADGATAHALAQILGTDLRRSAPSEFMCRLDSRDSHKSRSWPTLDRQIARAMLGESD